MSVSGRLVWRSVGQPFTLARTRMAAFADHNSRGLGRRYNLVAVDAERNDSRFTIMREDNLRKASQSV